MIATKRRNILNKRDLFEPNAFHSFLPSPECGLHFYGITVLLRNSSKVYNIVGSFLIMHKSETLVNITLNIFSLSLSLSLDLFLLLFGPILERNYHLEFLVAPDSHILSRNFHFAKFARLAFEIEFFGTSIAQIELFPLLFNLASGAV